MSNMKAAPHWFLNKLDTGVNHVGILGLLCRGLRRDTMTCPEKMVFTFQTSRASPSEDAFLFTELPNSNNSQ
jgi:hypothetical protein